MDRVIDRLLLLESASRTRVRVSGAGQRGRTDRRVVQALAERRRPHLDGGALPAPVQLVDQLRHRRRRRRTRVRMRSPAAAGDRSRRTGQLAQHHRAGVVARPGWGILAAQQFEVAAADRDARRSYITEAQPKARWAIQALLSRPAPRRWRCACWRRRTWNTTARNISDISEQYVGQLRLAFQTTLRVLLRPNANYLL